MIVFTKEEIAGLDHLFRINLVNSLSGYKSANLIATVSEQGEENVAVFSSVVHLGSNPPLMGFILRPTTVPRNTYANLKANGVYTINHIAHEISEDAHHTSAKYPAGVSEFEQTNLSSEYRDGFAAPFVAESPISLAMRYREEYLVQANGVIMIVGEIEKVYMQDGLLHEDGFVELARGGVMAINGLDGYSLPDLQSRYPYQRPRQNQNS